MKVKSLNSFGWGSSLRGTLELLSRHGSALLQHMTPPRLANLGLLAWELLWRKTLIHAKPIVVKIEPTNICNFRCPGCRTGSGEDTSPRGMITFEDFRTIVDQTHRHAFKCILYMWGEPLIHRDIFRMIRYAEDKNLAVQISSNMNVFRQSYAEQMVESGLEHLIVAMDGVSQEVYQTYRVGGRVQKVVDNVRAVVRERNRRRRTVPLIELQYVVFPHNRHELGEAQRLAEELGVDRFTIIDGGHDHREAERKLRDPAARFDKCNALWIMACFNWDGSFSPCCDSVDDTFGNVLHESFGRIWNSKKTEKSRSLFTRHPLHGGPATKCSRCRICGSSVFFLPP